jgi:hypothetical protein
MPVARSSCSVPRVAENRVLGGMLTFYEAITFYMLFVYPKNEQEDLTPTQLRVLGRLVREEFK